MAMCSFADRFSMFDVTPVENLFIEEYMLRAPGDYVKVYIYGLRLCYHPVKEASVTSIARALGLEEKTVMDAFAYWERVGVLRRQGRSQFQHRLAGSFRHAAFAGAGL